VPPLMVLIRRTSAPLIPKTGLTNSVLACHEANGGEADVLLHGTPWGRVLESGGALAAGNPSPAGGHRRGRVTAPDTESKKSAGLLQPTLFRLVADTLLCDKSEYAGLLSMGLMRQREGIMKRAVTWCVVIPGFVLVASAQQGLLTDFDDLAHYYIRERAYIAPIVPPLHFSVLDDIASQIQKGDYSFQQWDDWYFPYADGPVS